MSYRSRKAFEEIGQHRSSRLRNRPGDHVVLVLDALVPLIQVLRVVGHHMVLTAVLTQPVADATSNGAAIDGDADVFIGHAPQVVDLGGLELEEAQFGTSA